MKKWRAMVMQKYQRPLVFLGMLLLLCGFLQAQAYRGKGRLSGIVKDSEGSPMSGTKVKLFHVKSNAGFEVVSSEKGEWTANWLRGGEWDVDFEKEGYVPEKISITIQETGRNPEVQTVLKRTEAPLVPREVLDALDKGNALYDGGRFDEAIQEYQRILAERPQFYQVHLNLGNALMKKEDYAAALSSFERVLEKDQANTAALIGKASCYVELKDFARALETFNLVNKDEIRDPVTLYNVGTILYNNGQVEKALEYYERSLALNPDFADSVYQLGLAYLARSDNARALGYFQEYLKIDPDSAKAEQVRQFIALLEKK